MEGEKAILEWNDVTTQSIQGQHSPNSDVYEKLANLVKFVENGNNANENVLTVSSISVVKQTVDMTLKCFLSQMNITWNFYPT